jgi:hypothetical protein
LSLDALTTLKLMQGATAISNNKRMIPTVKHFLSRNFVCIGFLPNLWLYNNNSFLNLFLETRSN